MRLFFDASADLIKETVNKEISDYISSVNTASGLIRDLIKKKAGLLSAAAGKLGDGVGNIKSAVANVKADGKQAVQDKVGQHLRCRSVTLRMSQPVVEGL